MTTAGRSLGSGVGSGGTGSTDLLDALEALRGCLGEVRLPLDAPGAAAARAGRAELFAQLDDYVLPRLRRIEAPLLAVVGGSTGAGKSTLVNSLVGAEVSPAGVLRPTTRAPVLVCAQADVRWFADRRVLPGLPRVTGDSADPGSLRLVPSPALAPGLAVLDAPDIDSVVTANRELGAQLLAAADLWLFVTSAARYADAVPWELLRTAAERATALAVVLDRVPAEGEAEVREHLAAMLAREGLAQAPLFVVRESPLTEGRLPEPVVAPLREWLTRLAEDVEERQAVVRATLEGAVASVLPRGEEVAAALDAQVATAEVLRREAIAAYDIARDEVETAVRDGSLLRGEVLARWQDLVGTGELLRSLEGAVGRFRDRISAAVRGRPAPGRELRAALEDTVETVVSVAAARAAERAAAAWEARPAGAALLAPTDGELGRAAADLPDRLRGEVRGWQSTVLDLVSREGAGRRSAARVLSLGVNGAGLAAMIAVFAHTGGLTGGEVVVAGGASALAQKVLEAVFGDEAVRRLAATARADLLERVERVLGDEADRYLRLLDRAQVDPDRAGQLREALSGVAAAGRPGAGRPGAGRPAVRGRR
ncbi:MAG TPA: dynamin family protein [Mycobacteriales bacterium]|nr:dynamin family protein [Mycobacteriales bacterium]